MTTTLLVLIGTLAVVLTTLVVWRRIDNKADSSAWKRHAAAQLHAVHTFDLWMLDSPNRSPSRDTHL